MFAFDPVQLGKDYGVWVNGKKPNLITGFSFDTRQLQEGNLFLALKTENRDGHDYLDFALEKGACGAIVEKVNLDIPLPQLQVINTLETFHKIASRHREDFSGLVIGITGSCGKTTTKDFLNHLLAERTHATLLNYNNLLGVPMTLMGLDNKLHRFGIIEAGMSIPGEMRRLASMIRPDISIITNVFPVHLEGLGTIENIAREKALLAEATRFNGLVLFPSSCLQFGSFHCLGLKARVLAGRDEVVNFSASQIVRYEINENVDDGLLLYIWLSKDNGPQIFKLPILSEGVSKNVTLVIVASLLMGIKEEQIRDRLPNWMPSKHRGQVYYHGEQVYYVDCYNANPVSMLDALAVFQKRFKASQNHLYILGSMAELSDYAAQYHYNVGKALKLRPQDRVLLIGTHARDYELGLKEAGNDFSQIICLQNKEKAFDYLNGFKGTVFLKGSKPYALWELLPEESQLEELKKV